MPIDKNKGSGPQYFDITAPSNNQKIDWYRLTRQEINFKYVKENSYAFLSMFFSDGIGDKSYQAQTLPVLEELLNNPTLENKALLSIRLKEEPGSTLFEKNRVNLLHYIASMPLKLKGLATPGLLKSLITAVIASGVHPLEKSQTEGETFLGILFSNSGADEDLLKFVASLHPQSLLDLSEEGETAMQLAVRFNRTPKILNWLAESLPLADLEKNIKSIESKIKKSKRASDSVDVMRARLEKHMLNSNLATKVVLPAHESEAGVNSLKI